MTRGTDGVVDFVGRQRPAPRSTNPAVSATTSVRAAARRAPGAVRSGVRPRAARHVLDVRRPLGHRVAPGPRAVRPGRRRRARDRRRGRGHRSRRDRQLGSVLATLSDATALPSATVVRGATPPRRPWRWWLARPGWTSPTSRSRPRAGGCGTPRVLGALDSSRGPRDLAVPRWGTVRRRSHTVLVDDRTRGVARWTSTSVRASWTGSCATGRTCQATTPPARPASRGPRPAARPGSPTSTAPSCTPVRSRTSTSRWPVSDLDPAARRQRGRGEEARRLGPLLPTRLRTARTPTRSGTASRCSTAPGTPAPTTWSVTR